LDSEILAEVYLELVGGRQPDLVLSASSGKKSSDGLVPFDWRPSERPSPLTSRLSESEKAAHEKFIATFETEALWLK
jgi:DNA polymerase-3 subunit epsilon